VRRSADTRAVTGPLLAQAKGSRDRRSAAATCTLTQEDGSTLFALDVTYQVLAARVFQRMFATHRRDLRLRERATDEVRDKVSFLRDRRNPYQAALPLEFDSITSERGRACLREISADLCAGHFPLYPAMPIALLMHGLSTLCGEVLRARVTGDAGYTVARAEVSADRLAFAGQPLHFEARCVGQRDARFDFVTRAALSDETTVGEMQVTLERC